ncbi:MAG: hypothetical protein EOO87_14195 [Pedobacter sp.]|nr:MAG: hypothetical protein EOO87_14195 [Pedobacter sp.]
MKHSVLLDTSFFIRLLNDEDPLHKNALGYYRYFLEKEITLKISTISIAEYCVRGELDELPLRNLQIMPFNLEHAQRTGEFAHAIFIQNNISIDKLTPRAIIPNDSKLFAQADVDRSITHFITSDNRSKNTFASLNISINPKFVVIDIAVPYNEVFGILDL